MTTKRQRMAGWLDIRLGVSRGRSLLEGRRVQRGRIDYDIGSAVVFLLGLQAASGVLMLMHYRAGAEHARESVATIETLLPFGSLIRGVHHYGGDLLVVGVIAYVFTLLARRLYRAPRELVWMAAVATLVVALALNFTGSLLPWSQSVYAQTQVASSLADHIPLVGHWLKRFMLGGELTSPQTLGRAFGFHVAVLPATLTLLVLVQAVLLSADRLPRGDGDAVDERATMPVYPDLVVRHATLWATLLLVVVTLATFRPHMVGEPLDLAKPSAEGARPAWYFLFVYALLKLAPADMLGVPGPRFIVVAGALLLLAAFWLPFVDRRGSRVTAVLATVGLVGVVGLSFYALG